MDTAVFPEHKYKRIYLGLYEVLKSWLMAHRDPCDYSETNTHVSVGHRYKKDWTTDAGRDEREKSK